MANAPRLFCLAEATPHVGRLLHDLAGEHASAVALGDAMLVVDLDAEQP